MIMKNNRINLLVKILILVIVVLLVIIAYVFIVRPTINGYTIEKQNQGYEYAILQIAEQAATCQQVPLTIGEQTINLIAVECLQSQE
jgi:hypothetical protein